MKLSRDDSFWKKLKRPFFALAPMYDVTDAAFRSVVCDYGKPDVMMTEFVSADGLLSVARKKLSREFIFAEKERPIVAQLFGRNPENMGRASEYVAKLGFDGIDINMGCPERNVMKQGAGAALISEPELAKKLILAAKKSGLPVSVKTRTGIKKSVLGEWLPNLLSVEPAAITIHGRTAAEMSRAPADWDEIGKAVEIARGSGIPIIGNGDVLSIEDGSEKCKKYGVNGLMIGRAALGNPWIFSNREPTLTERIEALINHIRKFENIFARTKDFSSMKKHFKAYVRGFHGATHLREKLMDTKTAVDAESILSEFLVYLRR